VPTGPFHTYELKGLGRRCQKDRQKRRGNESRIRTLFRNFTFLKWIPHMGLGPTRRSAIFVLQEIHSFSFVSCSNLSSPPPDCAGTWVCGARERACKIQRRGRKKVAARQVLSKEPREALFRQILGPGIIPKVSVG
jgi:hypothetical protein